jgi:hypothetical protein
MCIIYIHIMTASSILFNAYKFKATGTGVTDSPGAFDEKELTDLASSVKTKDNAVSAVLTKQKQVNNILTSEINRLKVKKEQIDNARQGQMRVLMMNESYRKRQSEYMKLIIAVVVVFALVIVMRYTRVFFNVLPEAVYTLLHILLFASVIIYSMITYVNVSSREKINFDRLDIPGPKIESTADFNARNAAAKLAGDLLGVSDSDLCKGAACCTAGATEWNLIDQKCVKICTVEGEIWSSTDQVCK